MTKKALRRLNLPSVILLVLATLFGCWFALRRRQKTPTRQKNRCGRILIVGAGAFGRELVEGLRGRQETSDRLLGYLDDGPDKQGTMILGLPVLGQLDDIEAVVREHDIEEVYVALPPVEFHRLASISRWLPQSYLRLHVAIDINADNPPLNGVERENIGGLTLIVLQNPAIDSRQRFSKRLIDWTLSAIGLFLLAPIMLVVALAVYLEDGGPPLYRAQRVGENGDLFKMFKFRSMVVGADELQPQHDLAQQPGHVVHKHSDDPRVTRVGRFIRRTSLDELPNLINVFLGDMSLVGPRPELPWLVETYEPWQHLRFSVPQGLTGWWQINGRSDRPMHLNTDQDIYYIQHYSLWLDLKIFWRTVFVVLRGRGAY